MTNLPPPAHLEMSAVTVDYDHRARPALDNVSLSVPQGIRLAVVGPNGAGKSTLFKAIVGLLPLSHGTIRLQGLPIPAHQDGIAYVPQREEVDWRFPVTVRDVVMMGRYGTLGWLKHPTKYDHAAVQHALTQMDIQNLARRSIGELSGGQQQRVFLARALAQEPRILLMDEPFTGVDVTTQEATLRVLEQLQAQGVTLIVSTHDLNLAGTRFDRVLLLNHRVIAYGKPSIALSTENLMRAYGSTLVLIGNQAVVDDCCPPDEHHALGESPSLETLER